MSHGLLIVAAAAAAATVTIAQAPAAGSGQAASPTSRPGQRPVGTAPAPYYPARFDWQRQTAEQARLDGAKLDAAV